jgi:predicted porin
MNKAILATAVALATVGTAMAQPQVEVYGKMRLYQERDKVGTASAVTRQSNDSSRLGFRGTEDLGQGMKAFFTLETGVGPDQPAATTMGDRTSLVGLSTSVWRLGLGRDKHQVTRVLDGFDALDNSFGTTAGTIHQAHGSRVQNAAFLTVTPLKNVNLHYQHSSSETAGVRSVQAYGADAAFGAVSLAAARYDNGLAGAEKDASTTVGAKFAVGSAGTTLFALYSDDTVDGAESQGKTIGVQQKLPGALTLMASYGEKQNVDGYAVGATYNLSKRTMLHARFRDEDSTTDANDRRQFGVGLEHNF